MRKWTNPVTTKIAASKCSSMWRYIPGVKRPQPPSTASCNKQRRQVTFDNDDDSIDVNERRFVSSWKEHFPWVEYDGMKMFCRVCKTHKKKNAFASSESTNFRRSAFTDHTTSMDHSDAIRVEHESAKALQYWKK